MSQHINLLTTEFLPARAWLDTRILLVVIIMILVGLSGFNIWLIKQNATLAQQEKQLQTQLESTKQQLEINSQQRSTRPPDPALLDQIKHAEQHVANKQKVLAFLQSTHLQKELGFSRYMQAFADRSTPGLWITRFYIASDSIEITGNAVKPPLIAEYLASLSQDTVFRRQQFSSLETRAVNAGISKQAEQVEFKLKSFFAESGVQAASSVASVP